MSGGGGRVSKGRMGSSLQVEVDPDELEDMQQRLEQVVRFRIANFCPMVMLFNHSYFSMLCCTKSLKWE